MDVVEHITPRHKKDDEEDPEELRCLYVALTRARKELYVFAPRCHYSSPFVIYKCKLSRFINYDDVLNCMKLPDFDIDDMRKCCDTIL
jgi:superfamily I DNA/RNA helicase